MMMMMMMAWIRRFFCLFDLRFWVEYEDVSFVTFSTCTQTSLVVTFRHFDVQGARRFWGYLTLLLETKSPAQAGWCGGRYILLKFGEAVEMVKCPYPKILRWIYHQRGFGPFPFEALASLFALDGSSLPLSQKKQRKGRWWRWLGISCSFLAIGPTQKKDWLAFISWK